ncbi:MAG: type II restriction endonuclease [Armatimonadota bacterium]
MVPVRNPAAESLPVFSDPFEAIETALRAGRAILKVISPNDAGLTGTHQWGFYLPKNCWQVFTAISPEKGGNAEEEVSVLWPDGTKTDSRIKWYGNRTRSEYRLTRFGRGFRYLNPNLIGDLLVLVPLAARQFRAFVVRGDDQGELVQAALGIPLGSGWGAYSPVLQQRLIDTCLEQHFAAFLSEIEALSGQIPSSSKVSLMARQALQACDPNFNRALRENPDHLLIRLRDVEYELFKRIERTMWLPRVRRGFHSVEEFIETAQSVLQRRKARAGKSLEHHVDFLLSARNVPHEVQPDLQGRPDVIIPSASAYLDPQQRSRTALLAIKTSCRDRWRQVLQEAPGTGGRYLLTLQPGITRAQVEEILSAGIKLVVPKPLHSCYEKAVRTRLLSVRNFLDLWA